MPCHPTNIVAGLLPVPDATPLWRYMDMPRLVALLATQSLWLARADTLEDALEGSHTVGSARRRSAELEQFADRVWQDIEQDFQRRIEAEPDEFRRSQLRAALLASSGPDARNLIANASAYTSLMRQHMCVNCWHANESESVAMWRLYGRVNEAVAIQSTVGRVCRALAAAPQPLYVSGVQYRDYRAGDDLPANSSLALFTSKDVSFAHEREVRVLYWHSPTVPGGPPSDGNWPREDTVVSGLGVAVPVDVPTLVEAVYVAPSAPGWFRDTVEAAVSQFGLARPVCQSRLTAAPIY